MFNLAQFMSEENLAALTGILAVYAVIIGFFSIFGIICYVFQSIGLFKMAKSMGFNHTWMAWVPFFNTYTLGKIGSKYVKNDGKPSAKFGGWLVGFEIAMIVTLFVIIGAIIAMIPNIITMTQSGETIPNDGLIVSLLIIVLSYLLLIGISIAYCVIYYIALWRMFAIFSNSNATVFLILSILFSITTPFFIFAIRNNTPLLTYNERMGYIPVENNE